jgi:hypothetical protein
MSDFTKGLGIRERTGGCLGVHKSHDLRIRVLLQRIFHFLRVDRRAPFVLHHYCRATAALHVFDHTSAKHAIAAHDHFVARVDHVDETHFHSNRAGSRNRERHQVGSLERIPQQALQFFHHVCEYWVEMAERWTGHGG